MSFLVQKGLGLGMLAPGNAFNPLGMLAPQRQVGMGTQLSNALSDLVPPPPPPSNPLATAIWGESPRSGLGNAFLEPDTKRKAYFAFRFEDIMRVNNVRKGWCSKHPDGPFNRSFYDRSMWGKSKASQPEALKALMRDAVVHSSAVCALIGTNTWKGRWVKYEIARAVVDGRGLLAVHINGLNHHQRQSPDQNGINPLRLMGIYHSSDDSYYIYEYIGVANLLSGQVDWQWRPYDDFKTAVSLPQYIPAINQGWVMPLAAHTSEYDYVAHYGATNIGTWIDCAAMAVGR